MTHQQGSFWVCYWLLWSNLGDCILCTLSPNHNIKWSNGINDVYQRWTTYALKSKSLVSEMHFPGIWRSTFTDFASKKTQSSGKNGCRQKCLEKSLDVLYCFRLYYIQFKEVKILRGQNMRAGSQKDPKKDACSFLIEFVAITLKLIFFC